MKSSLVRRHQNKISILKAIFFREKTDSSRRAFTLLQVLVVISITAVLSAMLFGVLGHGRETTHRAQCDTRLKAIVLALDAYKQDNGQYPLTLAGLRNDKYLNDPTMLRCPNDPRQGNEAGYEEYYVLRSARDANDMPLVTCPFHEDGGMGVQAFKGRYTTQYSTCPARIVAARNTTIQRPGKSAIAAAAGMELRGGDRISTGSAPAGGIVGGIIGGITGNNGGEVVIEFADRSTATLSSGTTVTVLQSFLMGQKDAPLYTILRQSAGEALYKVTSGSKFDVVTPTATSGARGTKFKVTVKANGETELYVIEGAVAFTTLRQSILAPLNRVVSGLINGLIGLL